MQLQELLRRENVILGFEAIDKWDALDKLLRHLVGSEGLSREIAAAAEEAVVGRERSMSTGMERGIAIPHAAVDGIEEVVGVLAVAPEGRGLSFESIDGAPTHLMVLLLIPRSQKLLHIRTLADVARVLSREPVRKALRAASTTAEGWDALAED
jgi:mannitol/fructose-specific phosphotransferase system IIA component (Ntr-type)